MSLWDIQVHHKSPLNVLQDCSPPPHNHPTIEDQPELNCHCMPESIMRFLKRKNKQKKPRGVTALLAIFSTQKFKLLQVTLQRNLR